VRPKKRRRMLAYMLRNPEAEFYALEVGVIGGYGSVYVLLAEMEGKGYVTSDWERLSERTPEFRGDRKVYRLTPAGIEAAREEIHLKYPWTP
jgi:DNA-binding PadR family transcriptional regulator